MMYKKYHHKKGEYNKKNITIFILSFLAFIYFFNKSYAATIPVFDATFDDNDSSNITINSGTLVDTLSAENSKLVILALLLTLLAIFFLITA